MHQPDLQKLFQLAQSPEGQQLMKALQKKSVPNLPSDPAGASSAQIRDAVSPLLKDPQIRALLKQLEGQL